MSEMNNPRADTSVSQSGIGMPACQECGRQDETLRAVAYPFVFSLVFVTFRRAFQGIWCSTHRAKYHALAGLITSIFGWFGIPFGLIYTPIALFELASGGTQPAELNVELLRALADDKSSKGDNAGAVRCLEECLKFGDHTEIKQRLDEIRPRYGPQAEPVGCWSSGVSVIGMLYLAIMIGMVIGMVDYGAGAAIGTVLGSEIPLFLIALQWIPLLAGAFLGGVAARRLLEQSLMKMRAARQGLAVAYGTLVALTLTYGIFEGVIFADLIRTSAMGEFASAGDALLAWALAGIAGGVLGGWFIIDSLPGNAVYLGLITAATAFFLVLLVHAARQTVAWQKRIRPAMQIPQSPVLS